MKTKNLVGALLLFSVIFNFVSCDKDDKVNINQLTGKWSVYNDDPNLAVDGVVLYTFNADKTCIIYCYDALSNRDTTVNRTYVISIDNTLLTIYKESPMREDGIYTEQYYIRKLTSNKMVWENASPKDGNSNKKLVKVKE